MGRALSDSNILVYAFSEDARCGRALELLKHTDVVSVQALNEFSWVARQKLKFSWSEVRVALSHIQGLVSEVSSIDLQTHEVGVDLAERYGFALFDALMIAVGLQTRCTDVWSEDMQDGLVVEGRLTIRNPFKSFADYA